MNDDAPSADVAAAAPCSNRRGRMSVASARFRLELRRTGVALLSLVSRAWFPFFLLGAFNRVARQFDSVFFCYAGNHRYAEHYSWPRHRSWLLWFPSIIGVFKQGGRWGLICASPVTENEFMKSANAHSLARLCKRLETVRKIIGARQLSMAGMLPSFLARSNSTSTPCTDYTAHAIRQAVNKVRHQYLRGRSHGVVILGGAGRVGRTLHAMLREDGIDADVVDTALSDSTAYPSARTAILLIDVSRHGAVERHIESLPPGSVIVNDVFPEPRSQVLEQLRVRQIGLVHLSGVTARVIPSLPLGYQGAVPCCAIHAPDSAELVLKRLA